MYHNQKISKENVEDMYELTPLQQGILFHYLSEPNGNIYVQQLRVDISGHLNLDIFKEAWLRVYQYNEIMRSVIRWEKLQKPIQIILKDSPIDISYVDATDVLEEDRHNTIQKLLEEDQEKKIDLLKVPHRIVLCRFSADLNIMILTSHHIIIDGWSQGQLIKEFFEEYEQLSRDHNHPTMKVKPKFKTYIHWLRQLEKEDEKSFWSNYLSEYTQTSTLLDLKYSNVGNKIQNYTTIVSDERKEQIQSFCKKNNTTLAILIYAAWALLLSKYNDYDDILFGTTVSGRTTDIEGINEMVGLLINTPPLRIKINDEHTVEELIGDIKRDLENRTPFTHVSLTDIKTYNSIQDNAPLFNSIVVVENYPIDLSLMNNGNNLLKVLGYQSLEYTNFPLMLTVQAFDNIQISLQCRSDELEQCQIKRCLEHLLIILEQMVQDKQLKLSDLNMIGVSEKNKIIDNFNNTVHSFPRDKTIDQLFEEQVERTPDNTAIIFCDNQMTYRQVSEFSNYWAGYLKNQIEIKTEELIGLFMERSMFLVPTALAIHKSGGAYVPLDPLYPQNRLKFILDDSGIKTVMTLKKYRNNLKELLNENKGINIVCVDDVSTNHSLNKDSSDSITIGMTERKSSDLAYVMYTSGSTGNPKGVMVEHRSVVNHLNWMHRFLKITENDVVLHKTPFTFDVSILEMFLPILYGAKISMLEPGGEKNPEVIIKTVKRDYVTILHFVPSVLQIFLQYLLESNSVHELVSLEKVFCAGEALHPHQAQLFKDLLTDQGDTRLLNLYGPTEATIGVTCYECDSTTKFGIIPIGKPIDNTQMYVLDKQMRFQPVGVLGELWIAGESLSRGYINQPILTQDRFKENPFLSGTRMYRTGDLARWRADGNLEYLGRNDQQVKVRGFRIELGEIEHRLLQDVCIQEAAVVIKKDNSNMDYIVAYFVAKEPTSPKKIRETLKQSLPMYMIPDYIFEVDQMPLTASGKLDRKTLQLKDNDNIQEEVLEAPSNETERKLVELFKELLKLNEVGVTDNFFSLGGHSLNALTLISRIHKIFNVKIHISQLYTSPTIRELAVHIFSAKPKEFVSLKRVEAKDYYPLSASQINLFVLQQAQPNNTSYNMPFAVSITGKLERQQFVEVIKKMVMRHEALRTSMVWVNDQPMQHVDSYTEPQITYKSLTRDKIHEEIKSWIKPFNLFEAPLFRAALFNIDTHHHICIFDLHHIISDGISLDILINEFSELYLRKELSNVAVQYKDYIMWHREMLNSDEMKKQENYWLSIFADGFPSTARLFDYPHRLIQSNKGNRSIQRIDKELYNALNTFSRKMETTLFVIMLSAYYILLSKYTAKEDIVVGTPMGGRTHIELQNVVGLLVNTIVLRNYPNPNKMICDFIAEVKQTVVHGAENQDYPLSQLMSRLQVDRKDNVIPLFSCMFTMSDMKVNQFKIDELEFENIEIEKGAVKFDLSVEIIETGDDLLIMVEFAEDIFTTTVIEDMTNHYINIVNQFIKHPDMTISDVNVLSGTNGHSIIDEDGINRKKINDCLQAEFEW